MMGGLESRSVYVFYTLENFQRADGSTKVPRELRPYVGVSPAILP